MPTFRYRALSADGALTTGEIAAANAADVTQMLETRGLTPIESARADQGSLMRSLRDALQRPRAEDITIFTSDLALLLRTGARINDALELLAADDSGGRIKPVLSDLRRAILSGEGFADAVSKHPQAFPPIYIALIRVGEASGGLAPLLEAIANERQRAEALMRSLYDALRYPAFLMAGAGTVLLFFLLVVLPQFANVFSDFNAKLDPTLVFFLALSNWLRAHWAFALTAVAVALAALLIAVRRPETKVLFRALAVRLPLVGVMFEYRAAQLFCRNLGLMLASGVPLPDTLRILADMSALGRSPAVGSAVIDRVRQGGRLSDALAEYDALPALAVRTLRLGENSGRTPELAHRVADYYEARLQRSIARFLGLVGPAAIIVTSLIIGGLIVSVMTALLSVNQMAG